jgi:hypothetical protein
VEDLDVDGRIILKWISKEKVVDWINLVKSRKMWGQFVKIIMSLQDLLRIQNHEDIFF